MHRNSSVFVSACVRIAHAAFFLLALLAQPAAAATVAVDVTSQGDKIEIEASALLHADTQTAWRVLTDYERYVDFIPGLRQCRVLARRGTTVSVEQSGEVSLWLLHMPLDVTFEIVEIAPARLDSRVVAGDLRALTSRYALTTVGDQVRLEYTGELEAGFALFSSVERLAVKQNVGQRFQALAEEIERQTAGSAATPGLGRLGRE